MGRTKSIVQGVVDHAHEIQTERRTPISAEELVPSGSTLLNLACSDTTEGAYGLGKIVTIPGSSSAGKTLMMLSTFAEANKCPHLDKHRFVYDDVEEALGFDMNYLFGASTASRIEAPDGGNSNTIENFKTNIMNLSAKGDSFIYILDSFDALTSDDELEKEMRKALAAAKSEEAARKIAGSYGTEKAKIAGQTLRMIVQELQKTNSLLLMVQQLRQNLNAGMFGKKHTTSGGEAPFFYSHHQVWLSRIKSLKLQDQKIGSTVKADVVKNKMTGKERSVEFDIFYDYGIDDIGSCIDFLVDEGWWKKKGRTIDALELNTAAVRKNLITAIEEEPKLYSELVRATGECWKVREESLRTGRVRKYS